MVLLFREGDLYTSIPNTTKYPNVAYLKATSSESRCLVQRLPVSAATRLSMGSCWTRLRGEQTSLPHDGEAMVTLSTKQRGGPRGKPGAIGFTSFQTSGSYRVTIQCSSRSWRRVSSQQADQTHSSDKRYRADVRILLTRPDPRKRTETPLLAPGAA